MININGYELEEIGEIEAGEKFLYVAGLGECSGYQAAGRYIDYVGRIPKELKAKINMIPVKRYTIHSNSPLLVNKYATGDNVYFPNGIKPSHLMGSIYLREYDKCPKIKISITVIGWLDYNSGIIIGSGEGEGVLEPIKIHRRILGFIPISKKVSPPIVTI